MFTLDTTGSTRGIYVAQSVVTIKGLCLASTAS